MSQDIHSSSEAIDISARLQACLHRLEHVLPAQAPLRDFVHHNTLHGFAHLPFAEALAEAGRLTGANPWLSEARCRELLRQGRIDAADLAAALRQLPGVDAERVLPGGAGRALRRGDVLQAALRCPLDEITPVGLRWQIEERGAFERLQAGVDERARQRLLAAGGNAQNGEAGALADLWAAAREVLGLVGAVAAPEDAVGKLFENLWGDAPKAAHPWTQGAAGLWHGMVGRLGSEETLSALLAQLTGEDVRETLRPTLIRHLAAHLDEGLAAWPNPARGEGFYAAWRLSASSDWAWELDELPGARRAIAALPDHPLQAIVEELERLGPDEAHWCGYLERLALELPGWSGMFLWRALHPPGGAGQGAAPVSMLDYLAVRLVLERLHAEHLVHRLWNLPLLLSELGDYFLCHPAELWVRHACGRGELPEDMQDAVGRRMASSGAGDDGLWTQFAESLTNWRTARAAEADASGLAAWPLFCLAQHLGLSGRDLREIGAAGAAELLHCARSLNADQRGHVWLLAYEHHYRQQIFAALIANHGRCPVGAAAAGRRVGAQLVFCMDDREEGTRRHLEEVNPALQTFGAAGFFGVPMLWQGLDDAQPSALCPIVVRPQNAVREQVAAGGEAAQAIHQRRRKRRLAWQERLHQGTRRGLLQAPLLSAVAAPLALLGLLGRTLAPARLGAFLARLREGFDRPVAGALRLTAEAGEAGRSASADAPRAGFSEAEQVERVGGFLRSIGLTGGFAPLVVLVGHGSDSRNNPHLAAYDCGACSGRHGGPNARVFAAMANRPALRAALASRGIVIPEATHFVGAEHNTCDESFVWYDVDAIPAAQRAAFAALCRDTESAARLHAVERCRRFASAPDAPSPEKAQRHLANRRQDIAQARPELGHATIAAAFVGRREMSRGAFFDRRVFLISYDPAADADGRVLEATLLAAGPVGAGISLEYYFSTVDNERFGCGTKIMHNLAGLFGVMEGANSDLRTGLPRQMIEIHEAMRLLVVVEQTTELVSAIYQRQPALQELVGKGWIVLAAKHPDAAEIALFDPAKGWQPWTDAAAPLPRFERSHDCFAGQHEALAPALLLRPLAVPA